MGNKRIENGGSQSEGAEEVASLWKDVFLSELAVAAFFHPLESSPTYEIKFPHPKFGAGDISIITRAFRKKPYYFAHSIVIGVYSEGRLVEYASAINTIDEEGTIAPRSTHEQIRGKHGDHLTPEILTRFSLSSLRKMEQQIPQWR